ncbi:hypothetical protein DICVIV_13995 [Dictyocaulus viviparus]|uniref:Uncharacterized protein n=1 Tax=Dictyocaulus viviparus TaxID=29172 RepID=A0A0D8XC76_DICVI|nr:hypothetical protein DICVIV_13995 [Dictyocaulus viviparus]
MRFAVGVFRLSFDAYRLHERVAVLVVEPHTGIPTVTSFHPFGIAMLCFETVSNNLIIENEKWLKSL